MSLRPKSLSEVAERSESVEDFGRYLRDWLHEVRRISSRSQVRDAIQREPTRLAERFAQGELADAWLGAYAEHLAGAAGVERPRWAFVPWRIAKYPSFDEGGTSRELRLLALAQSPLAFKRRNLFTPAVDLPLRLRPGRPIKSEAEKRETNAERQRRFRRARKAELADLRKQVALKESRSARRGA